NPYGSTTSSVATLMVGTPPAIVTPPQSQTVGVGSSVLFNALASGTAPLTYQWLFNGNALGGKTNSILLINSAHVSDGGSYRIRVASPYGSATSAAATLAVITAPVIFQSPTNVQVTVGGSAVFNVVAASSGPLSYQWFHDGVGIPGASGPVLTLNDVQLSDAGDYLAQVTNFAGSATSGNAGLLVLPAPPPPPALSSYSINIQPGLNLIANQLDNGGNTLQEIIQTVPPLTDGSVISKYDNASGTWANDTYSSALGAWVPGNIRLNPGEGAFFSNASPATLNLTFSGTPHVPGPYPAIPAGVAYLLSRQTNAPATYQDIVGTGPVADAAVYKWNNSSNTYTAYTFDGTAWSGGSEPTAAIGEAMWIAPAGGAPVSQPLAPVITLQPANVSVAQGDSATFSVTATGTAPLFYQWRVNNNPITGATNDSVAISNVQPANAGNYSVTVNNLIGTAESSTVTLQVTNLAAAVFADHFTNAFNLGSATNGTFTGSNVGATREPGEPTPANIAAGASVWLRWQAPMVAGQATFTTAGSDFDTLLAAYTGGSVDHLTSIAADDDGSPPLASKITFNVVPGTIYSIQIDGVYRAMGNIVLAWNFTPTTDQLPGIATQPRSQTVPSGTNVTLSVVVTNIGAGVSYQWYANDNPVSYGTDPTLTISNISFVQGVGLYRVAVTNTQTGAGVVSEPADVQTYDPTGTEALNPANAYEAFRDKFAGAIDPTPPDPNSPHNPIDNPPISGYSGTAGFTVPLSATVDPGETAHCGYTLCRTLWATYSNNVSGQLTIDTKGTTFNAVLAIYTGSSVQTVVPVPGGCTGNHGTNAGEKVTVTYASGIVYDIVVQPVSCTDTGTTVHINYSMAAPALVTSLPSSRTVTNGGSVTLAADAAGTPPVGFQWRLNGVNLPNATGNTLNLPRFQANNEGSYTVVTTNLFATNESAPILVYLSDPAHFISFNSDTRGFTFKLAAKANSNYIIDASSNLIDWIPIKTNSNSFGFIDFTDPIKSTTPTRFYRSRKP
ncbi:MAG: large repetitive protein, partial [Verrucomicrobiota bacterium]